VNADTHVEPENFKARNAAVNNKNGTNSAPLKNCYNPMPQSGTMMRMGQQENRLLEFPPHCFSSTT
jgi:hypothetical protein